ISYRLDAGARGRGIATEAAAMLARFALEGMSAARVEIHCPVENVRGAAVAARIGFERDADGRYFLVDSGPARRFAPLVRVDGRWLEGSWDVLLPALPALPLP